MKKREMIKSHREFSEIIGHTFYLKNKNYTIYIRKGNYSYPHFGIAVSKKLGNAVNRNLLKRRMRQILDEYKKQLSQNEDYIIIMKENLKNASFKEMKDSFESLIEKRRDYENKK